MELNASQGAVMSVGLTLTMCLANYYVGLGPTKGLTVGGFFLFIQYNNQLTRPLRTLGRLWRVIREATVDVEQIMVLLEVDDKIKEVPDPVELPPKSEIKGKIEFKNVSFTYDSKLPKEDQRNAIENLSFTIEPGSSVGIVG